MTSFKWWYNKTWRWRRKKEGPLFLPPSLVSRGRRVPLNNNAPFFFFSWFLNWQLWDSLAGKITQEVRGHEQSQEKLDFVEVCSHKVQFLFEHLRRNKFHLQETLDSARLPFRTQRATRLWRCSLTLPFRRERTLLVLWRSFTTGGSRERIRVPSHLRLPTGVPRQHLLQKAALRQTAECLLRYE